jgi:arginine deiminase
MDSGVTAEWDTLREVVIHRPGIEMFFGLLEPFAFLYERAFSMDEAVYEHSELEHALGTTGARVHRLKRLAVHLAKENTAMIERARKYVMNVVNFRGPLHEVRKAKQEFKENITDLDPETIFNIMLLRPSVILEEKKSLNAIFPRVTLNVPLANLYFMRDQQAVSDLGVIVGRMSKPQRVMEPFITSTVLEISGAKIAYRVRPPGRFEGGDFIPAGEFAMLGIGDRTNRSAVNQILENGVNFDEVAVVHQPSHPLIPGDERDPMIDMHLDTYLNLAGNGIAVGCLPLLKRAPVEVFRRTSQGRYTKKMGGQNLYDYLLARKFSIVPVTTLEQMSYASNFLCTKDRQILAVEVDKVVSKVINRLEHKESHNRHRYARLLQEVKQEYLQLRGTGQFFPHKKEFLELGVESTAIQLQEITGGYGGAHCMTCVLSRRT